MAFTGDLAQLNILDVIQLIHTTRKSGTFTVKGSRGESRIIFSNGYIVGASHLNNRIRIGTVLVRTNAITEADLKRALEHQNKAGKDRKPLVATLIELGILGQEEAFRGLKKLIEITIIELIRWSEGVFTFDVDAITVSDQCSYLPGKMDQVMSLDAQMVLMDALRILDETERDRASGKSVPSYEEQFAEVLPPDEPAATGSAPAKLTASDLGLEDLDSLEKKLPQSFSITRLFDPREIHRQKTRELLAGFSQQEQDVLIAFLEKSAARAGGPRPTSLADGQARAFILFSRDDLLTHTVMTMCKDDDVLVFTADQEAELEHIVEQCQSKKIVPLLVFDSPEMSEGGLTEDKVVSIRLLLKDRYPQIPMVQFAPPREYSFMLEAYCDGISATFPKPSPEARRETFVADLVRFLEAFQSFLRVHAQQVLAAAEHHLGALRDRMLILRDIKTPAEVSLALLQAVSEPFARGLTLAVGSGELVGERAIGIFGERNQGSVPASRLRLLLDGHSVFDEVIGRGRFFYGERDDTIVKTLWKEIGTPLRETFLLLPVVSSGAVAQLVYADFGKKEVSLPQIASLEMLANHAGLVIEHEGCGLRDRHA